MPLVPWISRDDSSRQAIRLTGLASVRTDHPLYVADLLSDHHLSGMYSVYGLYLVIAFLRARRTSA